MAMLARLKEDLLLYTNSDNGRESASGPNDTVDINIALKDVVDLSNTHTNTNTVKDELRNVLLHKIVNSCPPPQLTKRFGICCQDAAERLTFPVGASATCWGLSALSILGDQLVKDLYSGKTTNKQQMLDHMMDSIPLLASANFWC